MSAPVTEAHRELARTIRLHLTLGQAYQLIADSEAKAVAELRALVGTIRSQLNLIPRNVGDITPAEHSHETGAAIDQLRAEVERLKEYSGNLENDVKYLTQGVPEGDPLFLAVARAERAEAELATAKAIIASIEEDGTEEHNAAVRLRQELATERAKYNQLLSALVYADQILDDIDTCSDAHKPMYSSYSQNVFKLCIKGRDARRAAIDAAMKEGA